MPTIRIKFSSYVVYRIDGKINYITRGVRVAQNVEWIDPTLAGELIMRTQTLPDENIYH